MEYGINLTPNSLALTRVLVVPESLAELLAGKISPFDPKKHNTKVVIIGQNEAKLITIEPGKKDSHH